MDRDQRDQRSVGIRVLALIKRLSGSGSESTRLNDGMIRKTVYKTANRTVRRRSR
jgi:hypothetical protein